MNADDCEERLLKTAPIKTPEKRQVVNADISLLTIAFVCCCQFGFVVSVIDPDFH